MRGSDEYIWTGIQGFKCPERGKGRYWVLSHYQTGPIKGVAKKEPKNLQTGGRVQKIIPREEETAFGNLKGDGGERGCA